uniref:RWD domain-containing protein n=1 Tax=Fagus sylvatica TaxID=28930 RepID=A0A2N9HU19_FAGSY
MSNTLREFSTYLFIMLDRLVCQFVKQCPRLSQTIELPLLVVAAHIWNYCWVCQPLHHGKDNFYHPHLNIGLRSLHRPYAFNLAALLCLHFFYLISSCWYHGECAYRKSVSFVFASEPPHPKPTPITSLPKLTVFPLSKPNPNSLDCPVCSFSPWIARASENLGMAMVYTLVSTAKEWLSERYGQDASTEDADAEEAAKDDVVIPHGEPVTIETFLAWRERFEAELALERAKLMPESALTATKEKRLSGRQWFESGRGAAKGAAPVPEGSDEEDVEDIDFDDDDFEDDEEDMLEHYLAEKSDSSSHSSRIAN